MQAANQYQHAKYKVMGFMIAGILFMGLLLIYTTPGEFWHLWMSRALNILSVIFLIFFNLSILIPDYLKSKGWMSYAFSILVFLGIFSPLRIVYLYFLYANSPENRQVLLEEQSLYYLADFLIIFLSTTIKLSTDWVWNQRRMNKLEKQNIQSEIKLLKAQINPHFLFNTLNNIYALSLKNDPNTPEVILKLSGILRYILYECNEKEVPLLKEWTYIENYIDLEKLRLSNPVKLEFEAEIKNDKFQFAPLILMTFVENAFKHGLKNQDADTFIRIKLYQEGRQMSFNIVNSKPPVVPQGARERRGIGLENIKKRLELLYPAQYELDIKNTREQYQINLQIDKRN
ncbi:MAG TPA: histidine kinase [Saprospiraceae bacterium]|nr:histidine kinase [Saprospiraceae bacterium]